MITLPYHIYHQKSLSIMIYGKSAQSPLHRGNLMTGAGKLFSNIAEKRSPSWNYLVWRDRQKERNTNMSRKEVNITPEQLTVEEAA